MLTLAICFLFLPLLCFQRTGERRGAAGHLVGFSANYFLALPFYLFLPPPPASLTPAGKVSRRLIAQDGSRRAHGIESNTGLCDGCA